MVEIYVVQKTATSIKLSKTFFKSAPAHISNTATNGERNPKKRVKSYSSNPSSVHA